MATIPLPTLSAGAEGALIDSLSPRERQLLELATSGHTDPAIANELEISLATVSTYWGRIRIKFGPLGRTEIVARHLRALMNRANAELQASETRLKTVLDANPVGIFLTDAEGGPIYMNSAYIAIAGTDEATLVENGFTALVFPEGRPQTKSEGRTEGAGYVSEHRWTRADGSVVWVRLRSEEWHHDGEICGRVGVVEDVTVEHEAHKRRLEAEERYSLLFALAPEAIVSVDENHRISGFNASAESMFGYKADEIAGEPLERLLPGRFHSEHAKEVHQFGQGASAVARPMSVRSEVRGLHRDGKEFACKASILHQSHDGKPQYTAFIRAIVDERGESPPDPLDAIPLVAWRLDAQLNTIYWNVALRTYLGETGQSERPSSVDHAFIAQADLEPYAEILRRAPIEGGTAHGKIRLRRGVDDELRWHRCHAKIIEGSSVVVCTDIHETELAEDELRRVRAVLRP